MRAPPPWRARPSSPAWAPSGRCGRSRAAGPAGATTSRGPSGTRGRAVVAYVRDAATGEVRLMSGEREVVVHDRALARTLASHFDEQEG